MGTLKDVGDEIQFLKKRHVLVDRGHLVIFSHTNHFSKLFELTQVKRSWKPKNVPAHPMINEVDETQPLSSSKTSSFRTCVGILLHLACDLVECQFVIRALSKYMSSPTVRAWDILKYLVLYLLGRTEFGLGMKLSGYDGNDGIELKIFTDSDWPGHKGSRKSASSCFLQCNGVLLRSSSRTQGTIALSSAEAEVYSAVSGCCDGIYILPDAYPSAYVFIYFFDYIDNSAARQILLRSGCGRVRHLSTKVLWLQQRVGSKEIKVSAVSSKDNISDLGAKRLPVHVMRYLMYMVRIFGGSQTVGADKFEQHHFRV